MMKLLSKFVINIFLFLGSVIIFMSLCRLVFIIDVGYFDGLVKNWALSDVFSTLANGLRYDGRIVGAVSVAYMLLYLCFFRTKKLIHVLTSFTSFIILIVVTVAICEVGFFKIYGDTFNIMLLGLIYDDQQALWQTAIGGEYNLIFRTSVVVFSTTIFTIIYYTLLKKVTKFKGYTNPAVAISSFFVLGYAVAVLMTSTFGLKGGSIDYLITPSKDLFLRKSAPGALRDLHLVYIAHVNMQGDDFEKYSNGFTPHQAASIYFEQNFDNQTIDLNSLMEKTVETGALGKVDHIFVIIGESLSSWHFDNEFREAGLAGDLEKLYLSGNGKRLPVFLENAEGTIGAVDVMLTGLYSTGTAVNERTGGLDVFKSSNDIFHKLGYENRFYYFGSASWRKLDAYALSQGFDKMYSISDMEAKDRGVWGVADNVGFDFVVEKTKAEENKPSFNMILSTMYHPPYNMQLDAYGVPVEELGAVLDKHYPKNDRHHETDANLLGHAYLANKMIADFVEKVIASFPNSIVVVTGDHFDRMYPEKQRSPRVKYSVPFIIYGGNVDKAKFIKGAGSHIDIIPTILELTAPKGFVYHSFGKPLMSFNKNARVDGDYPALGYESIATERFIADGESTWYSTDNNTQSSDKKFIDDNLLRYRMGKALSWWIINKGYRIGE